MVMYVRQDQNQDQFQVVVVYVRQDQSKDRFQVVMHVGVAPPQAAQSRR